MHKFMQFLRAIQIVHTEYMMKVIIPFGMFLYSKVLQMSSNITLYTFKYTLSSTCSNLIEHIWLHNDHKWKHNYFISI